MSHRHDLEMKAKEAFRTMSDWNRGLCELPQLQPTEEDDPPCPTCEGTGLIEQTKLNGYELSIREVQCPDCAPDIND